MLQKNLDASDRTNRLLHSLRRHTGRIEAVEQHRELRRGQINNTSRIGGQVNRLCSNHFVTSTMPLPSHASSFTRSERFERKTNTSPPYGLARSTSLTSADKVWIDFLKSTGCAATQIFRSARNAITDRL